MDPRLNQHSAHQRPVNQGQGQADVAIIGAGCAGLAAASLLASSGIAVTVFEAAPQLGGRARGITYQGLTLDNGQHILLGAYAQTLQLLRLAGVSPDTVFKRVPLSMHMYNAVAHQQVILSTCKALPAPLHLLTGLLRAKGLSFKDKYYAIRFMSLQQLRQFKLDKDLPLAEFLAQQLQTHTLISHLWEPLCLAALNTPLAQASSQVFLNVLRDSFAQQKSDSDFLLPKHDLSTLIAQPLRHHVEAHKGRFVHATVQAIAPTQQGYSVHTAADTHHFSNVIVAVGPHQLEKLHSPDNQLAKHVAHFSYQPITTVYLQYAKDKTLPHPMQGMVQTLSQWVFDRGQLYGQHGLMAVVISAVGQHQTMTQSALAQSVAEELQVLFPHLGEPLWHKVVSEKRATFSCDAKLKRPDNCTPLPHLYLAGDYTAGDYPATIEGAIRSGLKAAQLVLDSLQAKH